MKLPKDRFFLFSALVAAFILIGGLLFTLFAPPAAYGAEGDFVPLVAIPNVNYATRSLGVYVNSAFNLIISLVAMLAVLRVITGGFKYMTTEAIGAKGDARETIQGAVFGLILLLGSWLILNTVNPQILDLSALQFESLQQEGDAKAFSEKARKERAEWEQKITTLTGEGEEYNGEKRWILDAGGLTQGQISKLIREGEKAGPRRHCSVASGYRQPDGTLVKQKVIFCSDI